MAKDKQVLTGHDCSFVDPLPADLQSECSICLHILREPYLVDCCGYRFCRACIEQIQKHGKKRCPLCKETFNSMPDKQLARILNAKVVYCTHKDAGCDWKGKLAELDMHLCLLNPDEKDGCKFVKVECCFCNEQIFRFDIERHTQVCASEITIAKLEQENSYLKEQLRVKEDELQVKESELKAKELELKALSKVPTKHLRVTNLPPSANKHNLQCLFGQYGTVQDIKMNFFGQHSAKVTYTSEKYVKACKSYSDERGLNLKLFRLRVVPEY